SPGEEGSGRDTFVAPLATIAGGLLATAWAMPLDQRPDESHALTYTTAPLERALEVTGTPAADLFVSSSSPVAYFHVGLCDVAPDGTSKLISDGGVNAAQRVVRAHPKLLSPGRVYRLRFDLKSLAYVVSAGHRLRIDVSGTDFENAWPASQASV